MPAQGLALLFVLFFSLLSSAQDCTNLGQNPGTAFPVCGSSVFEQATVAICGQRVVPVPCPADGDIFHDQNPYWYKFTCFSAGTLGFVITPNNLDDDYDWQLFDVTGRKPQDVYTDRTLFVACNWSGETGITGASAAGSALIRCGGTGIPLFSSMPGLQQAHSYLLLVSHFTSTQSGYSLSFGGGTASITDTTKPKLLKASVQCDGRHISIKLNKQMKCSSLAADGSDFTISGNAASISGASAVTCNTGFDMDSLVIETSASLQPGNYTVSIKKGRDENTLLDNCNAPLPAGDNLSFTVTPPQPSSLDSITATGCAPSELQLVLKEPITCNSVASDGSDFMLTGTYSSIIKAASAVCSNDMASIVKLTLSSPIYSQGTHTVTVKRGSDGNTLLNPCLQETPAGMTVSFTTKDTVSADFIYNIVFACRADTVAFFNKGGNGINTWNWQFDNTGTSDQQNPVYSYRDFGIQQVKLAVSNGICTDTTTASFDLNNELKASFIAPGLLCPADVAVFKDTSIGKVVTWNWDFANGSTSAAQAPPAQMYPPTTTEKNYKVRLIISDNHNCFDTAYNAVKVLYNCYIAVATAFTPNGDGVNDYLYPINAYKAKNLVFKVYNRLGQLLFSTTDFMNKWDGTYKGIKQGTGAYVWTLRYINTDTGKSFDLKGTSVLIR